MKSSSQRSSMSKGRSGLAALKTGEVESGVATLREGSRNPNSRKSEAEGIVPECARDLRNTELPGLTKSSTSSGEPMRDVQDTSMTGPVRANECRSSRLPGCKKSNTRGLGSEQTMPLVGDNRSR